MADLTTKFAGLELKNPIVIGSSGLTDNVSKIKDLAENGAGAVILKSLFEEQITYEADHTINSNQQNEYPEAADYIKHYTKDNTLSSYIDLIKEAKKAVNIPVIASINCISASEWVNFARKIEDAGADALEVNVFVLPIERTKPAKDYEQVYFDLYDKLSSVIDIPVFFKLGQNFTNLLGVLDRLNANKVSGVTLFNRFYEPDIDIEKMDIRAGEVFSNASDIRKVLRWISIASSKIAGLPISASTGVHSHEAVVKMLLAGATTVQVCSAIYEKGPSFVNKLLKGLEQWMDSKGFDTIDQFKGRLNYNSIPNPEMYERSQFMKYFSNHV